MEARMSEFREALQDALDRLQEMAEIAVPGSKGEQDGSTEHPLSNLYWHFTPGPVAPPRRVAVNRLRLTISLSMALVAGQVQQGMADGALEREVYWTHIPTIETYFLGHRNLVYKLESPPQLPPRFFVADPGLGISFVGNVPSASDGTKLLGARFGLSLPFQIELDGSIR
jgi:hypothetical protein